MAFVALFEWFLYILGTATFHLNLCAHKIRLKSFMAINACTLKYLFFLWVGGEGLRGRGQGGAEGGLKCRHRSPCNFIVFIPTHR